MGVTSETRLRRQYRSMTAPPDCARSLALFGARCRLPVLDTRYLLVCDANFTARRIKKRVQRFVYQVHATAHGGMRHPSLTGTLHNGIGHAPIPVNIRAFAGKTRKGSRADTKNTQHNHLFGACHQTAAVKPSSSNQS